MSGVIVCGHRKKILNQVKESPFPEHCNRLTLANELGAFFKKKISDIRFELDAAATVHNNHSTLAPSTNRFQPSSSSGFFSYFELLTAVVSSIQFCIHDAQNWMMMDRLKLNPDKTKFLILGTRQQLEKVITSHLVVGESRISPSTK